MGMSNFENIQINESLSKTVYLYQFQIIIM